MSTGNIPYSNLSSAEKAPWYAITLYNGLQGVPHQFGATACNYRAYVASRPYKIELQGVVAMPAVRLSLKGLAKSDPFVIC